MCAGPKRRACAGQGVDVARGRATDDGGPEGRKGLLSRERGTIFKKWTNRAAVCVAFPNSYYIGMSNLAVHLLYRS
jgi:hypothetical protein